MIPPRPWIVCVSDAWGGLERVALKDAELLATKGARPRLVVKAGSPLEEKARELKLDVEALPFRPKNAFDPRLGARIRKATKEGFKIVHTHQPGLLGSIVPWIPRQTALVASRHILNNHKKRSVYHQWIFKRVDRYLVIGDAMKRNVIETHKIAPEKVEKLPLGIDLVRFDPKKWMREEFRSEQGVNSENFIFAVLGRLDPLKGQRTALHAFSKLKDQTHARLWFVGRETRGREGERKILEGLRKELGLEERVSFLGEIEDSPQVLRAIDALLMPSEEEAFGLSAIEAMAMGVPVILSSNGSGSEIAGPEGRCARLVAPGDVQGWTQSMDFIQENREAAHEMALKGQESARSRFDERLRLERTLQTYSEILFDKGSKDLYT